MVKKTAAYPSPYLKAADLEGEAVHARIKNVKVEMVYDEEQPVMTFAGPWKPFPLNKTNFEACEDAFGSDESDDWIDKEIEIRPEKVKDPSGRRVDGVRLHAVPRPGASVKVAPNARARQETPPADPSPPASAYEDLDDEIPDEGPFAPEDKD